MTKIIGNKITPNINKQSKSNNNPINVNINQTTPLQFFQYIP